MQLVIVFAAILGLAMGSFLNVIALRYGKHPSFAEGRSVCPKCHHELGFLDLIPLVSFLLTAGKCRYCFKPISIRYPLVELGTAVVTTLLIAHFSFTLTSAVLVLLAWLAIVISLVDAVHMVIPDIYLVIFGSLSVIYRLTNHAGWYVWRNSIEAAVVNALVMGLIYVVSRGRAMGLGDVKLAAVLGLLLGLPLSLVGLLFGDILGALVGLAALATRRKAWADAIPFAPFLLLGSGIAMIYGAQIIDWYLHL